MRIHSVTAFVLGSVSVLLLGAVGTSSPQDPAQMQEMMKKAKKFTEPSKHHEQLGRFVGTWDLKTSFVMGGQKTPGESGTTEVSWLIDGRWLQMKAAGKMMNRPFEQLTLLGYDNFKQSYVQTSVNSIDTAMLRSEGDMTRDQSALVLYGTLDEYLTGEHDKMVKYVYRFDGADKMVMEVHDLPIGLSNTQVVEIEFTRRK